MKKACLIGLLFAVFCAMAWGQSIQISTDLPYIAPNNKACKGKTYSFSWTAQGHSENIKICLRRQVEGSSSEVLVIGSNLPGNGSLKWTIPRSLPSGYGYSVNFKTMAGLYSVSTGMFYIQSCLKPVGTIAQVNRPIQVRPALSSQLRPIEYEQFEQGAIRMDPASLTIRWGTHTMVIQPNEEKQIATHEDSDLIDPATHGLRATIEYTLRNTMSKNFRFHVTARFGNHFFSPAQKVTFIGPSTRHVVQNVVLLPANKPLLISVGATDILIDGGSNDVLPTYFRAKLHLWIYPN